MASKNLSAELEKYIDKVNCADTLKFLKKLPDNSIDLAVTSPPYNIKNSTGNGLKDGRGGKWSNAMLLDGYTDHADTMPYDLYVEWQRQVIAEVMRVLKEDGAFFYNHKWRVQKGLIQNRQEIVDGFPLRQILIWQRAGGFNFNPGYFLPTYEVIYMFTKPKFKLAPKKNGVGDVWRFPQELNNPHPAPFPVDLIHRIIDSTNAEIVLDPFMGSGTTAIAALMCDRHFIGIDLSKDYCKIANERIRKYLKHPEKGDPYSYEKIKRKSPKNKKPISKTKGEQIELI